VSVFSNLTDEKLVSLLKTNDQREAFTEIYNRYWDKLYYLAYKHLQSESSAEEIVQDIFLAFWKKRGDFDIQMLQPYLAAMVRYAVYKSIAKSKKKVTAETKAAIREIPSVKAENAYEEKNMLEIVQKLANILPPKCKLVFIQNKLLDLPLEDVASQLNISIKTAEAHLTKALKIVRENLKDLYTILMI
jgi:RNA polymerase sigma-70 factor (ECF subfamily)